MSGRWVKSSFSAGYGQAVEVKAGSGRVWFRNGKESGFVIDVSPAEWDAFLAGAKLGDFDDLAATP
jgi:hypothetical protein